MIDEDEAVRLQVQLAPRVERRVPVAFAPRTATGLDVAYGAPDAFDVAREIFP